MGKLFNNDVARVLLRHKYDKHQVYIVHYEDHNTNTECNPRIQLSPLARAWSIFLGQLEAISSDILKRIDCSTNLGA